MGGWLGAGDVAQEASASVCWAAGAAAAGAGWEGGDSVTSSVWPSPPLPLWWACREGGREWGKEKEDCMCCGY